MFEEAHCCAECRADKYREQPLAATLAHATTVPDAFASQPNPHQPPIGGAAFPLPRVRIKAVMIVVAL